MDEQKGARKMEFKNPLLATADMERSIAFYEEVLGLHKIIEVGENMQTVCRRFLNSGMTPEQTAERMDVPLQFVKDCM